MADSNGFLKNSFLTLSRQILGIIIGLGTSIIIARYLGTKGQGSYQLIILLPTMLITFLNLGIGVSSVYYVGKKEAEPSDVFKTNSISALGLSVISYIIGAVFVLLFSDHFFHGISTTVLLVMLLLLPFLFLKELLQGIFQGLQDFKAFNGIVIVGQGSVLLFVFIFLVVFHGGLTYALISFAVGQILTVVSIMSLLKKRLSITYKSGRYSADYFKKSFFYGVKAHISNILAFLNYRADMFILSYFLGASAVGLYSIAVSMAERLWIFSTSISSVLFPKISSLSDEEKKNEMTSVISRNVLFISLIIAVIFYLLSDLIIFILFGHAYDKSSMVLKLLLPGIVVGGMSKVISNDFSGRGRPEFNLNVSIFSVVVNIVLNIVLIPIYGINGSALATTVTYGLEWILKIILFKKISGRPLRSYLMITGSDLKMYKKLFVKILPKR